MENDSKTSNVSPQKEVPGSQPEMKQLSQEICKKDFAKKQRVLWIGKQPLLSIAIKRPKFLRNLDVNWSLDQRRVINLEKSPMRVLRPMKTLKNFLCDFYYVPNASLLKRMISSQLVPRLEDLNLSFYPNESPQCSQFQILSLLSKSISSFKTLKRLSLTFHSWSKLDFQLLLLLLSNLKACKQLKTIELKFLEVPDIVNQQRIEAIFQSLSHLRVLSNLHLNFESSKEINSSHFSRISKGILQLKPLSVLSLSLKYCRGLIDDDLELLCSSLLTHPNLIKLDLNFESCKELTDIGLKYVEQTVGNFIHLCSLTLNFSKCLNITTTAFESLLDQLNCLICLTELNLSFKGLKKVDDKPDQVTIKDLDSLQSLKSLQLDFENSDFSPFIESFYQAFRRLTHLQSLCWHFAGLMPEDSISQFITPSLKQLINLKTLHLFFQSDQFIGDQNFGDLLSTISCLKQLTSFHLSFSGGCSFMTALNITNQGIEKFSFSFEKMSSLRAISLDFTCFDYIDDNSLQLISAALAKIELLSELDLNLKGFQSITEKGMKSLSEAIERLKFLSDLKLNFRYCMKIKKEGFFSVLQTLKKLRFLKQVYLDFYYCDLFRKDWEHLRKELWRIPDLIVLSLN